MANPHQVRVVEHLTHESVLRETWWLQYCCCAGTGFGRFNDPTYASKGFCCCFSSLTECLESDCCHGEDGCCGTTTTVCCIVEHGQFPPSRGTPCCAILGLKCSGFKCFGRGCCHRSLGYKYSDVVYDYKQLFNDTFWIGYLWCCGFGCAWPGTGSGGHYCSSVHKVCCIRRSCHTEACCKDNICCECTATHCCLWTETSLPPHKDSPGVGLCGFRLKTPKDDLNSRPGQIEMK